MATCNRVVIMGNVTRDPEVRKLPAGTSVATLSVALDEKYRNQAGETVERTCFVEVVAWGAQAENCGKYLKKGSPVLIDGRLQYEEWEGKNGERRNKLKVRAESVQFLNGIGRSGGGGKNGDGGGTRAMAKAGAGAGAGDEPF